MIAKTFMGLEEILAQELTELGAEDVEKGCRVVTFKGDKAMMYKANFALRTAIRILKPIYNFKAVSADDVYEGIGQIDWSEYIADGKSFTVDSVVYSENFTNSRFVTYKVKDAIVDQFREKTGKRPSISVSDPDVRINVHISDKRNEEGRVVSTLATVSLDSSGESLHRRGYRLEQVEAPLNEVLAAGMILMTGWRGETDFIDPMCGSGTLPIEAALIARNIAPGVFRKEYAFEKWADFDSDLFDEIYNDDSREKDFDHHIFGYDIDYKAVNMATGNVKAAGLSNDVTIAHQDFADMDGEKWRQENNIPEGLYPVVVTNPPYGERISTQNLLETYKMIGNKFKNHFKGSEAWVLSYKEECFQAIGLKPSLKVPLYNGSLECEFRKYVMFAGNFKDFREEGGVVKTEDEKRQMAEKRRSWQKRDYEKKQEERVNNEEADIINFRFKSLEKLHTEKRERRFSRDREDGDRPFNKGGKGHGKSFDRDRKPFDRDRKSFDKDRKPSRRRGDSRDDRRNDRKKFFGNNDED